MPNCWLKSPSQLNDTLPPIDVDACCSVSFPMIILHRFFHFFQSGRCKIMLWWCSVVQLCLTLCDPTDCSMPGFRVLHHHLELAQTCIHWVGDAIQPCCPLLSPSSPALNLSQHQGLFKWVSFSHQVAKVLEFQL